MKLFLSVLFRRLRAGGGAALAIALVQAALAGFALISCAHLSTETDRDGARKTSWAAKAWPGAKSNDTAASAAPASADKPPAEKQADNPFPFPSAAMRSGEIRSAAERSGESSAAAAARRQVPQMKPSLPGAAKKEPSQRTPAAVKEPAKAQRNLAFFSPSVLPFAKNRDMARFYSQWATQFQKAVRHYRSAAKQYKKAAKHFEKMSEYTKKRNDPLFRKHFEEAAGRLKAGDGFLAKAQHLRKRQGEKRDRARFYSQ